MITIEPGKRGGRPCVRHVRITVADVLGWLAAGMSHPDILSEFPELTTKISAPASLRNYGDSALGITVTVHLIGLFGKLSPMLTRRARISRAWHPVWVAHGRFALRDRAFRQRPAALTVLLGRGMRLT